MRLVLAVAALLAAGFVLDLPGRPALRRVRTIRVRARPRRRRQDAQTQAAEIGRVLVEVAARLRAGAPAGPAWARALAGADPRVAAVLDAGRSEPGAGGRRSTPPHLRAAGRTAAAAQRLADELGIPLAGVLESTAETVEDSGRAAAERAAALAGPRATARLLAWLPALGLVLGTALGADPIGTALAGGLGTLSVVVGLGCAWLGRRWIGRLVRRAEAPT